MKKSIGVIIVVLIIVFGIYYFGFRKSESDLSKTIIAILPLTGSSAVHGEYSRRGIDLALKDLPAGNNVRVIFEDSQMDPKSAISEFNKDVTQNITPAVLSLGSPVAMALAPIAIKDKTVLMSIVSAPAYSSLNNYTFRINGTAEYEMDNVLQTIKSLGIKRLAVIYQNDDYGSGILKSLKQKYGQTLVAEEGFLPSATDMRSQLTKIKSSNPDGIFVAAYAQVVGIVAKQAKELNIQSSLICGSACDNPDLIKIGGVSAEGVIVVAPSPKANSIFEEKYKAIYKEEPNFVSIRMYDAVKLLADAMNVCTGNSNYTSCLKDTIHNVKDFPGAAFPVNFDQNGDLQDVFVTKIVTNGVLTVQ